MGNKNFREAISMALDEYVTAGNRFQKSLVVHKIVDQIQSQGGRFLKREAKDGKWYELTQQQSKEKVGHAIRDAANSYSARQYVEEESGSKSEQPKFSAQSITDADYSHTSMRDSSESQRIGDRRDSFISSMQRYQSEFDTPDSVRTLQETPLRHFPQVDFALSENVNIPFDAVNAGRILPPDFSQFPIQQLQEYRMRQQIYQQQLQLSQQQLINRDLHSHVRYQNLTPQTMPIHQQFSSGATLLPSYQTIDSNRSQSVVATGINMASDRQSLTSLPTSASYHPAQVVAREQSSQEGQFFRQQLPHRQIDNARRPSFDTSRKDDNDLFLDAINAVLDPIGFDVDDVYPNSRDGASTSDHSELLQIIPHEQLLQLQQQPTPEDDDNDKKPPARENE